MDDSKNSKKLTPQRRALAGEVAKSLLCRLEDRALSFIDEFLTNDLKEWRQLVAKTLVKGTEWGIARVTEMKDTIVEVCKANSKFMKQLSKFGVKSTLRLGVEMGTKIVAKRMVVTAGKTGVKAAFKTVANPVGILSDVGQAYFEATGREELGKNIGKVGNVTSGAMMGFAVGGPVGAAVGASVGGLLWVTGEVAGKLFDRAIS